MNDMLKSTEQIATGAVVDKTKHMADNLLFTLEDGSQEWHLLSGKCLILLPYGEPEYRLYELLSEQLYKLALNANVDLTFMQFYTANETGELDGGLCCWINQQTYVVPIEIPATRFKLHHFSDTMDLMVKQLDEAKLRYGDPTDFEFTIFWLKWMKKWVLTFLPKYLEEQLFHHYDQSWQDTLVEKNLNASQCWELFPGFEDEDVLEEEEEEKSEAPLWEIPHMENTKFRDYDFTYHELGLMREFKFDYLSRIKKMHYDYDEDKDPLMFNLSDEDIVEYWLMGGRCTLVMPKSHDIRKHLWNYIGEEFVDKARSELDVDSISLEMKEDEGLLDRAIISIDVPNADKYSVSINHKPLRCQIGNFVPEAMAILKPMADDVAKELAKCPFDVLEAMTLVDIGIHCDVNKVEALISAMQLMNSWISMIASQYIEYDANRAPLQCSKYCHKVWKDVKRKGTAILER